MLICEITCRRQWDGWWKITHRNGDKLGPLTTKLCGVTVTDFLRPWNLPADLKQLHFQLHNRPAKDREPVEVQYDGEFPFLFVPSVDAGRDLGKQFDDDLNPYTGKRLYVEVWVDA